MRSPLIMILALVAMTLAMSPPAMATDFTTPLLAFNGKPMVDEKGTPLDMTLGSVTEVALLSEVPSEQSLSVDEKIRNKVRRFALAQRIHDKKDVTLTPEELVLIKRLIGERYPAVVVGLAYQALQPGVGLGD